MLTIAVGQLRVRSLRQTAVETSEESPIITAVLRIILQEPTHPQQIEEGSMGSLLRVMTASLLVGAATPKEDAALMQLQGTWVAVGGGEYRGNQVSGGDAKRAGHRLVISGEKLAWYTALGKEPLLEGTIKLDLTKQPKALDLSFTRDGREVVGKCIYELSGDTLKLCYDEGQRPIEFGTKADAPNLKLYVFKRRKP